VPKNEAGDLLCIHLAELGMEFIREFKFYAERKWRADFCIVEHSVLIEINGGVWNQGRHTRGQGFIADMDKLNHATMLGFRVLQFSTEQVLDGTAKKFLAVWLQK